MGEGVIKRIVATRAFGFIQCDDRSEVFFHKTGVSRDTNFDSLREGDRVTFETEKSPKGPRAVEVSVL